MLAASRAPTERGFERLPAKTGSLEVRRRVDLGLPDERRTELAGPRVESAPLPDLDAPIDGVAQELVREVEVAVVTGRPEQEVVDQLLERRRRATRRARP